MTKHYVEFLFPGIIVSESSVLEIKDRNARIKPPQGAYAYQFFDREEVEMNGETLTGSPKNRSGRYFLGGTVKTRKQVAREMPGSILESNMLCNKMDRVVMTSAGQAMEIHPGDVIVQPIKRSRRTT